ncbi:unnamed protein product, partial [Brenthis ino]
MHLQPHLAARAFHKVRRPVERAAGRPVGVQAAPPRPPPPPRTHPRCLFSAEWRGDSRPRHALRTARAFPIHKHKQRGAFVIGRHVKKLYEFFLLTIPLAAPANSTGKSTGDKRRYRGKCISRVHGAGGADEGRVQAMMDIVLISICPLLPYCGDAGRAIDRCTGPKLTPRMISARNYPIPRFLLKCSKVTIAKVAGLGGRVECAGDLYSARARPDTVPPCEQPAMATETGAAGEQQYSLRWNDFHSAMVSSFRRLRDEEDFVDVTLACAGATFTAHKVVLSACSPYFRRLLKANPCQHPIVILRDVHDKDMESLLRFMYQGEVHIGQEQLKEFLRAAQLLQVRGLTDVPPPAPLPTLDQKASPSASSWTETGSGGSREGRDPQPREGRRARRPDEGTPCTPPPKRARSSDLYQAQMKTRTEQLLAAQGASPERMGTNGHELALFSQALENVQNPHLSGVSNNLSGEGEESSSDAGASDTEGENRAKQEPVDYDDPATMANTNGALPHNFPGLLNLPGFPGLPGPSGIPDNFGEYKPLLH